MAVDVTTEIEIARPRESPSGGTTMTLRNRGNPSGFRGIAAPMMAAAMRRANRKDLARLKALLERADRAT